MDLESLSDKSTPGKIWAWAKSPLVFVLKVTIPVVDEDQPLEGWCQPLHVLQALLAPLFIAFATGFADWSVAAGPVRVWHLSLPCGMAIAAGLLLPSKISRKPVYMALLAYLGFAVSVVWIYALANEIVSLLKTVGIYFGLSDAILGLTVLAWGNSIGDMVSDLTVARKGFPRMGFSACYGGPLFNLLLGVGGSFTLMFLQNGGEPIRLEYNLMVLVLSAALAVSLVFSLVVIPLAGFKVNRAVGIFMVVLYGVLLSAALFVEFYEVQ